MGVLKSRTKHVCGIQILFINQIWAKRISKRDYFLKMLSVMLLLQES